MRATGVMPILHILRSELFPTEIRAESIGLVQSLFLISGTLSTKFFPEMKNGLGLYGLFFLYAVSGFTSCLWALYTIPDNRGKSLVKVEELYEKKTEETKMAENTS